MKAQEPAQSICRARLYDGASGQEVTSKCSGIVVYTARAHQDQWKRNGRWYNSRTKSLRRLILTIDVGNNTARKLPTAATLLRASVRPIRGAVQLQAVEKQALVHPQKHARHIQPPCRNFAGTKIKSKNILFDRCVILYFF